MVRRYLLVFQLIQFKTRTELFASGPRNNRQFEQLTVRIGLPRIGAFVWDQNNYYVAFASFKIIFLLLRVIFNEICSESVAFQLLF